MGRGEESVVQEAYMFIRSVIILPQKSGTLKGQKVDIETSYP